MLGVLFSKPFFMGIVLAVGIFSKYIFGDNNLAEEISEVIYKYETGKDINFSPTSEPSEPKETNKNINEKSLKDYETTYDESDKSN